MAGYLDQDPDRLREAAWQLQRYADAMRKWGEIPEEWLKGFPGSYGTIAHPMHKALHDYYQKRHDKAEAQAASSERTKNALLAAADRIEQSELSGGKQIANSGPQGGAGPVPHGQGAPDGATPKVSAQQPDSPHRSTLDPPHTSAPPVGPAHPAPETDSPTPSTFPSSYDPEQAFAGPNTAAPVDLPPSLANPPHDDPVPATLHAISGEHTAPDDVAPFTSGYGIDEGHDVPLGGGVAPPPPPGPGPDGPGAPPPRPLRSGPFAASIHQAREGRQSLPPLVVGDHVDDDLTLARTLLSAVLFAIGDTAPGIEWATGVVRNRKGAVVLLTSTEGRGWLPPGLFLPSEVLIPWQWDSILDAEGRAAITTLESSSDPARILTEFGHHAYRNNRGRLYALASSTTVDDFLRSTLGGEVAVAEEVTASEAAVDLSRPGIGLSDRLDMCGSRVSRQRAAEIPDSDIHAACLHFASTADELVRQVVSDAAAGNSTQRVHRLRTLESLRAGQKLPAYAQENSAVPARPDIALSTAVFAPPAAAPSVFASQVVSAGADRLSPDVNRRRSRTLERRADELVSLLSTRNSDRATLRDVLYVHDQIAEHPQLQSMLRRANTGADVVSTGYETTPVPVAEYSTIPVNSGLHGEEGRIR
ncbi:hypothetical protein J2W56_004962 [Nocardia kruczakiae]|uniref:Uncharacterized protein n=1 Tax=Nocardia kruczakiae TaxID=261477 RepID=A0ABU1XKW2_9NOCA|nr:type VII secretion target [Nocardia kruczakiae]MDR7171203.1 hypothetical protein [Nocardia kruczakiae]